MSGQTTTRVPQSNRDREKEKTMKLIATLLIALMGASAFATSFGQGVRLNEGEYLLSPTKGEYSVKNVAPVCAPELRCAPHTMVTFTYLAGGCLDRVEHFYTVEPNSDIMGVTIYVSAFNISNEASTRVRCVAPATSQHEIQLPYFLSREQVEVKFIGLVPQQ